MLALLSPFVAKRRRLTGTLGERLQSLLAEQGQTVTWLAAQIGQNRVSVSKIVNDRTTDLPVSTIKALAAALGVTPGALIDEPDDPP